MLRRSPVSVLGARAVLWDGFVYGLAVAGEQGIRDGSERLAHRQELEGSIMRSER